MGKLDMQADTVEIFSGRECDLLVDGLYSIADDFRRRCDEAQIAGNVESAAGFQTARMEALSLIRRVWEHSREN